MSDGASSWILPAEIPFERLRGRDLEECVYWLLDSLGARDLEWRTGGTGGGASDGGRDLEAWFYTPVPDGGMDGQRWWIECKGRSGTLEPEAVRSACNNAMSQADLTYLVIATNTTFSNPTIDWVKDWQKAHPLPKIRLWDRSTLERMLSRHPNAVFRLYSHALSVTGLLEVAREGFWNRFDYAPPKSLKAIWSERDTLKIGPLERSALIVAEFARGRIEDRPWAAACSPHETLSTMQLFMANMPYIFMRAVKAEIEQEPLIRSAGYLILTALQKFSALDVARIVLEAFRLDADKPFPAELRDMLLDPVADVMLGEMQDVCSANCPRFSVNERKYVAIGEDPADIYWYRFRQDGLPRTEQDDRRLRIENLRAPCEVGFAVDRDHSCPLFSYDEPVEKLADLLRILERVSGYRLSEATG